MRRTLLLLFLCLLLLAGCAQTETAVSEPVTAAPTAAAVPTASPLPPLSPMAELLLEVSEDYDPALGAMETKRRCEELLAAWTADGEDGESAKNAAAELAARYDIDRETMSEKLDSLRRMAARLCSSDAGFVRDPTAQNVLPDTDSAERLFAALSEALAETGDS